MLLALLPYPSSPCLSLGRSGQAGSPLPSRFSFPLLISWENELLPIGPWSQHPGRPVSSGCKSSAEREDELSSWAVCSFKSTTGCTVVSFMGLKIPYARWPTIWQGCYRAVHSHCWKSWFLRDLTFTPFSLPGTLYHVFHPFLSSSLTSNRILTLGPWIPEGWMGGMQGGTDPHETEYKMFCTCACIQSSLSDSQRYL